MRIAVFQCFLLVWTSVATLEVKCPEFCSCDLFQGLKRATCRNRKLVSIELDLPVQAEILDISQNQISELGDKIFLELGLTNLKHLNISHNALRHIHFNGFKGLETVKTLDLSFNAIEYLTRSWFESLQSLEKLYLRANKLRSISQDPRIDIQGLKMLDISKCGITSLSPHTFRLIPNLETLDVSENFLQALQVEVLKQLPKLQFLLLSDNNFNCQDESFKALTGYTKSRKISLWDSCAAQTSSSTNRPLIERFQKMKMADEETTNNNSWIIEDDSQDVSNRMEGCRNVSESEPPGLLMEIIQLSPWVTLSIVFSYGVLCGMVLTSLIRLCTKKKPQEREAPQARAPSTFRVTQSVPNLFQRRDKKYVRRSDSVIYKSFQRARLTASRSLEEDGDNFEETLIMNEGDLANSTPMVTRKVKS